MARRSFFRRSSEPALVAGGQLIKLGDDTAVQAILKSRQEWQKHAWDVADAVGEVGYGVSILAALMSRLNLYPVEFPDDRSLMPVPTNNPDIIAIFERLGSYTERADLQGELTVHLLVPGEGYLCGIQPGEGRDNEEEFWAMASTEEVEKTTLPSGLATIKLKEWTEKGEDLVLNSSTDPPDTFIRIYRRSARHRQKADSHVRSILGAADELAWWDAAAAAAAKSRLAQAGIVAVPSNMELPAETEEEHKLSGNQRLLKRLYQAGVTAIQNPGDASAALPIITSYPWNERGTSGIEVIAMDRPQDELLEKRTDRALTRIAQGMNLPVEVITGLGGASHWGAGQIQESEFREHAEPLAVLIVNALTTAFLRPIAKDDGVSNPDRFGIWYDASNVIAHRDKARNVIRAVELGAANWKALRREIGLSEGDAPNEKEQEAILAWLSSVRRGTGQQGIVKNPEKSPESNGQLPGDIPQENLPGDRTPVEQPAAPLKGRGQNVIQSSANGYDPTSAIHSELISRLQVMCDDSVRRALEKAGNKLRSRANKVPSYKSAIRGVATEDIAATLGREAVIKLGINDLFDGCFTDISARFTHWCDRALTHIAALEHRDPTYLTHTSAASNLTTALRTIASEALFSPAATVYVPTSLITKTLEDAHYAPADLLPTPLLAT